MGIKGLTKFFAQHLTNPNCVRTVNADTLRDKVIAIDSSIYLYKFICAIKNNCTDIFSADGQVVTHIHAILTKLFSLLKRKIKPIFVFDNASGEAKQNLMKKRTEKKNLAKSQIMELRNRISEIRHVMKTPPETQEDIEHYKRLFSEFMEKRNELKKCLKKSAGFSTSQSNQCKELLRLIGVPYINSLEEADPQCSQLVKSGIAYAVSSEDMDILTFGTPRLITSLSAKQTCKIYDLNLILADLDITYDQFIDVCILLGCDYTCTIRGLGIKKILEQIIDHGNIEGIIASEQFIIPEDFDYLLARKMFTDSPIIEAPNVSWTVPDYPALKEYLQINYSYTDDEYGRISDVLKGGYYSVISGEKNMGTYQKDCRDFRRRQKAMISLDSDED
jgi:flap endonuclease-1